VVQVAAAEQTIQQVAQEHLVKVILVVLHIQHLRISAVAAGVEQARQEQAALQQAQVAQDLILILHGLRLHLLA
jgi:hypothetical protein